MIIKKINLIKVALFLAMLLVSSMAMSAFTVNGENYPTASEACGSLAPPPPDGETPPALSSVQNEIIGIHDCYSTEVLPKCEGPGTGGAELGQTCAEFCASQEDESWSTTWTATSGNTGYCHYHWKHIDLPAQTLTWWQEAITVTDYTGSIRELLDEDVTEASERGYTKVGQTFPVYDTDQKACQSFSSSSTMEVLPSSTSGIYDCSTSPVKFTQCQGAGSDPGGVSAPLGQSCAEYCATRENDEWYTTWTPTSYTAGRCKFHWRHLEDVLAVNWGWWNGFIYEDQIVGSIQEFNRSDLGKPEQCSGNPINTATGNKYQTETDYTASNSKLRFQRTYNSYAGVSTAVGINWQSNYHRSAQILKTSLSSYYGAAVPTKVNITKADGKLLHFALNDVTGQWLSGPEIRDQLVPVIDVLSGAVSGFEYKHSNHDIDLYDLTGRLIARTDKLGHQENFIYNSTGQLESVTDGFGNSLAFTYNLNGLLETLTAPDGIYSYGYGVNVNLETVTDPDTTSKTYLYEDSRFPYALTGVIDENGSRFATWSYDIQGRAVASEHANGADLTTLAYNADGSTTVTNPLGKQTTYHFTDAFGAKKLSQIEGHASANCAAGIKDITYDPNGFKDLVTDFEGNITDYDYDTRGLEVTRTEAVGTPQTRTITTQWHAEFRIPSKIIAPGKTTDFVYNPQGQVLSRSETDTTSQTVPYSTQGQKRTWTYTYISVAGVQLLETVDGPRTDVNDVTTFTYDTQGNVDTVSNGLNQATTLSSYNGRGLPGTILDANLVQTDLTYDARGRLKTRTLKSPSGDITTRFDYDNVGQLTQVNLPLGGSLGYEYDAAHRLTAIKNNLGERIDYTLDNAGNRTVEAVSAADTTLIRTHSQLFDELSRLIQSIGADNQLTDYAYDRNDNLVSINDPLQNQTIQVFDPLNRLMTVTDALNGISTYDYDAQNNLILVTDPKNNATNYVYNGFGDLIQLSSSDAGVTVYNYDVAGNRSQQTDAKGMITQYSYDALNRLISKTYSANPVENVSYSYDDTTAGNKGIGRLTDIQDDSGSLSYVYDDRGNLVQDARVINGASYTTDYQYDAASNLIGMIYPSGRVLTYVRDTLGRIITITTQDDNLAPMVTVANNIRYQAFGPVAGFVYGNSLDLNLTYDLDGQLTTIQSADPLSSGTTVQDLGLSYDLAGNIETIANALNTTQNQSFFYDALHRVGQAQGDYGGIDYSYDAIGNRLTRDITSSTNTSESYNYDALSNQLQGIDVLVDGIANTRSLTLDANGNIETETRGSENRVFTYDASNRLIDVVIGNAQASYVHNALGQRVSKSGTAPSLDYTALAQQYETIAQGHNSTAATLTLQASTLRTQANSEAAQAQALTDQAATASQQATDARSQADSDDAQALALISQATTLRNQAISARTQADANEQQASDLLAQLPSLRKQAKKQQRRATKLARKVTKLQRRIDKINSDIARMEDRIIDPPLSKRDERRNAKWQRKIDKLIGKRDKTQQKLDPVVTQYNTTQAQADALTAQVDQNETEAASLQQQAISLRLQADTDEALAAQNEIDAPLLQQQAVALRAQADTLDAQASQLTADAAPHQQLANDLNAQAVPLEQQAGNELQLAAAAQAEADGYWALAANPSTSVANVHFIYNLNGQLISETHPNTSQKEKDYIYLDGTPIAMVTGNELYFIHTDHLGMGIK